MKNHNPNNDSGQQATVKVEISSRGNIFRFSTLISSSFAVAIIFFFFTFCEFSCGNEKAGTVSGIELVTGGETKDKDLTGNSKEITEKVSPNIWAILGLLAASAGLLSLLANGNAQPVASAAAGIIGAFSLLILKSDIINQVQAQGGEETKVDFQAAFWGAFAALALAGILSLLRISKKIAT